MTAWRGSAYTLTTRLPRCRINAAAPTTPGSSSPCRPTTTATRPISTEPSAFAAPPTPSPWSHERPLHTPGRLSHTPQFHILPSTFRGRDDHRCCNPKRGRRNLRVQAHHIELRSLGGSDAPDNGISECRVCHLRLIHTRKISVTRVGDALVWRYPGRLEVVGVTPPHTPSPTPPAPGGTA